jgi:hypothetical protein
MADYYTVLARAVVNLETGDDAAREELYERARSIIVTELRKQNPKISALAVTARTGGAGSCYSQTRDGIAASRERRRSQRQFPEPPGVLFATAYLAAIIAFSGVVYLRHCGQCFRYFTQRLGSVWRSSTPTLSSIRSCLALLQGSYVY